VGKLILASSMGSKYKAVLDLSASKNIGIGEPEKEILGCSHAEVGAYLLGIWGLPYAILEAVAWHQRPSESPASEFSPLTAVHAACVYHSQMFPSRLRDQSALDLAHLTKLGIDQQESLWRSACEDGAHRK
jgi:HD-like signal output (HDOD) protein